MASPFSNDWGDVSATFWTTLLVVALALLVGLYANRFVRPFAKSQVQGVK